jgi:hypothetical protein
MSGIADFQGTTPLFLPDCFFQGRVEGWVLIESLLGSLQRRATIIGEGTWDEQSQVLTFTETYTFDDGLVDTLDWTIRKLADGRYSGTESRLEGDAAGEQAGCAFNWRCSRDMPQAGGSSMVLNIDDWFYAIDERVCIVRGGVSRVGLPFATAHVTYMRW